MNCHARRSFPVHHGVMILMVGALLSACGNNDAPQADTPVESTPSSTSTAPAPAKVDIAQVKACSLITTAEVEAATGHKAMEPVAQEDRISFCTWGEPDSPMMGDKPLTSVAELSVFTGGNDYFKGPAAQANATFDMAARNAGEIEAVDGLGERAHWTSDPPFFTLRVVKGVYLMEVNVPPDFGGRQAAEKIAKAALQKLPE